MTNNWTLRIFVRSEALAVCRLPPQSSIPEWAMTGKLFSITRTPEELSLVCPQVSVPFDVLAERGWRCLQVAGPLDFSLTGVLASLSSCLAEVDVSIFAISTYDTDYLLVQAEDLRTAIRALKEAGHEIIEENW